MLSFMTRILNHLPSFSALERNIYSSRKYFLRQWFRKFPSVNSVFFSRMGGSLVFSYFLLDNRQFEYLNADRAHFFQENLFLAKFGQWATAWLRNRVCWIF